jgi:hypothetical protein
MVFSVTNTADTGDGSFRKAINDANANPGPDIINFNIPGTGPFTIAPLSKLPSIIDPVTIDGTTQTGYIDHPVIELNMGFIGSFSAFDVFAGGCTIRGLAINRLTNGSAIVLWTGDGNVIEGNYIGTDITGEIPRSNQGNGVIVYTAGNRIGGATSLQRNVISGDAYPGIVFSGILAVRNLVAGNFIGTDATGNVPLANTQEGVLIVEGAQLDTIGGTVPGARNIISGSASGSGISIVDTASAGIAILGNYIGTNVTGLSEIPNAGNGIFIRNSPGVTIGGTTFAARNVISGNTFPGIFLDSSKTTGVRILGNYIGTDGTGESAFPNLKGIVVNDAPQNFIGGADPGAGNVISGNIQNGIEIRSVHAVGNIVQGNLIGVDASGTDTLPNYATGVFVNGASHTLIGGGAPGAGNVIGGNGAHGVSIIGATANGNAVTGNYIGTDPASLRKLGNGGNGVYLDAAVDTIGYVAPNVIAHNKGNGVAVSSGTGHLILDNSLYDNGGLGIDLFPPGLTVNDTLDADTGANGLQNFPLLDSARLGPTNLMILGHLDSKPNTTYRLDFYSMDSVSHSHFGEGKDHLDSTFVTTGANGRAPIAATVRLPPPAHQFVSATATDPQGSTSEFSQCFGLADADSDGIPDFWETSGWGIDVNSDGKIDQDLYALRARPDHKDIFVEVDAMTGFVPPDTALKMVVASFANVPNLYLNNPDGKSGIALHATLDDTNIPVQDFPGIWTEFETVKGAYFGTAEERKDTNARYILEAKRLVYRYALFSRTFGTTGTDTLSSGQARLGNGLGGNEFMVTFGSTGPRGWNATKALDDNAGTFMHELGHTLGLGHGGDQLGVNYKPNYYSVMNYTWQTGYPWQSPGSWRLDYSPIALPPLNESNLNETIGLDPPIGAYMDIPMPFTDASGRTRLAHLARGVAVDWNGNGDSTQTSVNVDINRVGDTTHTPGEVLTGYADWPNLRYNFRNSPGDIHPAAAGPTLQSTPELTKEIKDIIAKIPPPKPSGRFLMDGLLDTSGVLLSTNAGINLYASYKSGQLYVATNSAQSRGADMIVFISDARNPLRSAPSGKNGQVAAWSVYLQNRNIDNSAGWFDAAGTPLTSVTVDTVGAVLEGVVDIDFLYGKRPAALYIAVGKYGTNQGDTLLAQAPAGNGDRNIDPPELFEIIDVGLPIHTAPPAPPRAFALNQNYPNPFNPSTTISYDLASAVHVSLKVYDILGQEVATLIDETKQPGSYRATWTPIGSAATGVYFVRIHAGSYVSTRKMLLVR